MEVHPAEIVIAIQIVQSAAAMVLAGLLLYFFKTFRHAFLHHWACSAIALSISWAPRLPRVDFTGPARGLNWSVFSAPASRWVRPIRTWSG